MLTEQQLNEIKEELDSSQNPLFFFDNDVDGLVSFLLFRRYVGRGKGVAVKTYPGLNKTYARKIAELKPDKIFILDKPVVERDFFEYTKEHGLPVVWIDHHSPQEAEDIEGINYYNPLSSKQPSAEPVAYLCWKVVKRDLWLALVGCLGDWFVPEFMGEIEKEYPDLLDEKKKAGEIIYKTKIGEIVKALSFALKDKTSNVMKMVKALIEVKTPYELFSGEKRFEYVWKRYGQIKEKYSKLIERAKEKAEKTKEKAIFFKYSGELSISSEIANELFFLFPEKTIVVAYVKGEKVNISLRGAKDMRVLVQNALKGIEGTGGGHPRACGATIQLKDLEQFKEAIEKQS